MRILLINFRDSKDCSSGFKVLFPNGLLYVAAALEKTGHNVSIIDFLYEEEFSSLDEELLRADAVGVSFSGNINHKFNSVLKHIKTLNPNLPCITGGVAATELPGFFLNMGFDFVVLGEAEETAVKLLAKLKEGNFDEVENIAFTKEGKITINKIKPPVEDLDSLPFPARHLINMASYDELIITVSRGQCPKECTFCFRRQNYYSGNRLRVRSFVNISDEMSEIYKYYPDKYIWITDDNFTMLSNEWFKSFVAELKKKHFSGKWICFSRVDSIDYEKLSMMKDAGCVSLLFGVESGSQRILDFYKKGITIKQIKNAFRMCKDLGLKTHAFFIVGSPGETKKDLKLSLKLFWQIKPDSYEVSTLLPMPGTPLYDYCFENKLLKEEIADRERAYIFYLENIKPGYFKLLVKLAHLTEEDLYNFKNEMSRIFMQLSKKTEGNVTISNLV
ncbi:MAG: radical SAM protein [Candidatus Omnitrophica bacterium]|nr:radical SAM protein [Candidatus Omnitrophota bacterium]